MSRQCSVTVDSVTIPPPATDFGAFGNFGSGNTGFNFFNPGSGGQGGGSGPTGGGGGGFNPTSSSSLRYSSSSSVPSSNSVDSAPFLADMQGTCGYQPSVGSHPSTHIVPQHSSHQPYYAAAASDGYSSTQYTSFGVGRQLTPSQITQFYPNSDGHMQTYLTPKGLPPGVPTIKQEPFDPTIER